MPKRATKVAISIPRDLYRAVEGVRRKSGRSRSALVQDALRHWLGRQAETLWVREYEAGYRRRPSADLLDALETLIADRWPGARRDGMAVVIPYGNDDEVMSIDVVPAFDRKARVLRVNRVALEPGVPMTGEVSAAIAELASFIGAEEVV